VKKIKLLIVDDQDLIRESLQIVLNMDEEIEVIGVAENGCVAVEMCERQLPDIVLMDIHMPKMDGVEATIQIKQLYPSVKVIILTTFQEIHYVVDALGAGAEGYLLKAIHPTDLVSGIKWVDKGGTLIPQEIAQMLVSSVKGAIKAEANQSALSKKEEYGLSEREFEILQLLANGLNNKHIAEKLFLSEGTVKNYISNLYAKLNVHDRIQAITKARDEGVI